MVAIEAGSVSSRRVIVADDDVLLRDDLPSLLERVGYELVGQALHTARERERQRLSAKEPRDGYRELLDTLVRVCRGGSVVDPSLVQQLVAAQRVVEPLTPRERECSP